MNDELYHYGVPGMKWGVKRNRRMVGDSKVNSEIRRARGLYKSGKITNSDRKSIVETAKAKRKQDDKNFKEKWKKMTPEERKSYARDIKSQRVNELPNRRVRKGLTVANNLLTANNLVQGNVAFAALSITNPALAPAMAVGAAVLTGGELAANHVRQRYLIDKMV